MAPLGRDYESAQTATRADDQPVRLGKLTGRLLRRDHACAHTAIKPLMPVLLLGVWIGQAPVSYRN